MKCAGENPKCKELKFVNFSKNKKKNQQMGKGTTRIEK